MKNIECTSPQAHFTEEETGVTLEDRTGSRTHCKAEVILGTMGLDLYFSDFFFFFCRENKPTTDYQFDVHGEEVPLGMETG